MKKKREPWTGYWEIYAAAIILFIAHIAVYILFFMYLTGVEL